MSSIWWHRLILLASGKSRLLFSGDVSRTKQLAEVNGDWPVNMAESMETLGTKEAEDPEIQKPVENGEKIE